MAKPIIDDALGKLTMYGSWRTTTMRLHLGSMLVDTNDVWVDEWSYYEMEKHDDLGDMICCEKAWEKSAKKCVSNQDAKKNPAKILAAKIICSLKNNSPT
jgi:hypothetical protein